MSRTPDSPAGLSNPGRGAAAAEETTGWAPHDHPGIPRVLVVDTDRALLGLLEEWLGGCGCTVVSDLDARSPSAHSAPFALVIVDLPHPRRGGADLLHRIAADHPRTPIVALSSTFFSGIDCTGGVARALGVACVLPKPVARESLVAAIQSLLRPMK
jgi:DNA-binding response OmpR family regulator